METRRILHFTLGPVQGFISQARRTRDLWSGSFLLSYLAGQAMYSVTSAGEKGNRIIFPTVTKRGEITDDLLRAIGEYEKVGATDIMPQLGTLPNRFQAEISQYFDPNKCIQAVERAWRRIANGVWEKYIAPIEKYGEGTKEIWNRQINGFWEMSWAVGSANNCLDRRKNWRSHVPTVEQGDKCTLMGNLQEISGYIRSNKKKKKQQDAFWQKLREVVGDLDLGERERLCAVSLVKRLFPLVAQEVIGWSVRTSYPSTGYIAAIPWLLETLQSDQNAINDFMVVVKKNRQLKRSTFTETKTSIFNVEKISRENPQVADFANYDSNLFYASSLANENLWPKGTKKERDGLSKCLKKFKASPSNFYGLLAVDGDRLGALLGSGNKEEISSSLARFSAKMPEVADKYSGVLIYAGGDDVLVLVPAQYAVALAAAIRAQYQEAFQGTGISQHKVTVSAAILYAHRNAPLKAMLYQVHSLLDDVAKDSTGRDSLAVQIWNTGGPGLLWAMPWEKILESKTNLLDKLVQNFIGKDKSEKQYNSSFIYNLRSRFSLLYDASANKEAGMDIKLGDRRLVDFFLAEYLRGRGRKELDREIARDRMVRLLKICKRYRRVHSKDKVSFEDRGLSMDGAILVRFLAEKGWMGSE